MSRATLVDRLAELIANHSPSRFLRVALDGPDAAGKTTLAAELAGALADVRPVVIASVDGFHQPREVRYRRGSLSPEGYYEDAYDYDAFATALLQPFGPDGDGRYRTASFDFRTDSPQGQPFQQAADGSALIVDGVFLLRPRLREHWDLTVLVDVTPDEALRRALVRDVELFGSADVVRERYDGRYFPAQRLYREEASPQLNADVVIDNDDPARPRILKWP